MKGSYMTIPKHLTPEELSERLGVAPAELATMRWKGVGPRFVKIGARVRYPETEIESFLASQTFSGAREAKRNRAERLRLGEGSCPGACPPVVKTRLPRGILGKP